MGEDARAIQVTPGVRADLERRFADQHGRSPSDKERHELIEVWKREEALYREALAQGLARNDMVVRGVLIGKMREDAARLVSIPEPSDAVLEKYLQDHRERYELPRRYRFQYLTFSQAGPKADIDPEGALEKASTALNAGTAPSALGRSLMSGKLEKDELARRLPVPLARRIPELPPGDGWTKVEGENELWLVRVREVSGGLPDFNALRARVLADFKAAAEQGAIERELQKTIDLYRFEEREHAE